MTRTSFVKLVVVVVMATMTLSTTLHTLRAQSSIPSVVDPKVMPDVLGIRLGMPAREADTALRAQYAKGAYRAWSYPLRPIPEPLVVGFTINDGAVGAAANDIASVDVTPPPNAQVVWRVSRSTNAMHVNRATLLAQLREKYGKETVAYQNSLQALATQDSQIEHLYWIIDERGQRAPITKSPGILSLCGPLGPRGPGMDENLFHGEPSGDSQLSDPWIKTSCIGTIVMIQPWQGRDPNIIETMIVNVVDFPLYLRSAAATSAWWKAANDKARQKDLETSKQNKPKL